MNFSPSQIIRRRRALYPLTCGIFLSACLVSCGGGGGNADRGANTASGSSESQDTSCGGECPAQFLSREDVTNILQRGVNAAQQLGSAATLAILDRVGNVLAVYQMPGALPTTTINGEDGAHGGLEGVSVPATLAAISKAGTGAYLSSQGQAFSTRTASQIIQEHFDPGEKNQPGGPLFGVQFSQLLCSDIFFVDRGTTSNVHAGGKGTSSGSVGPRPLPLGLSGDPGGFPLYKNGDLVGGIGVEIDGQYIIERSLADSGPLNVEEAVALAASATFEAPTNKVANNILVGGRSLRYSNVSENEIPPLHPPFADLLPTSLVNIPLYFAGGVRDGVAFGSATSGILQNVRAGIPAMTLVNEQGTERFPLRSGAALPGGNELQAAEVNALLDSALSIAHKTRAAIRMPLDSSARVSIFVIDTTGTPLGFIRSLDAPLFGIDVSLQKARTALFFSSNDAGAVLSQIRAADPQAIKQDYASLTNVFIGSDFLGGAFAVTARAIGNLARPFYPDGIDGSPEGPLSLPFPPQQTASQQSWSPFNDGLQLDLVFQRLVRPLDSGNLSSQALPDSCVDERFGNRLRNGIQIFAGSVPLYRAGVFIGALGVSGDGIDQDDMISFLGASRRGLDESGHPAVGDPELGFNAPTGQRSDVVEPVGGPGTRLRYVNCPEAPFIGSNEQNVCAGI